MDSPAFSAWASEAVDQPWTSGVGVERESGPSLQVQKFRLGVHSTKSLERCDTFFAESDYSTYLSCKFCTTTKRFLHIVFSRILKGPGVVDSSSSFCPFAATIDGTIVPYCAEKL